MDNPPGTSLYYILASSVLQILTFAKSYPISHFSLELLSAKQQHPSMYRTFIIDRTLVVLIAMIINRNIYPYPAGQGDPDDR